MSDNIVQGADFDRFWDEVLGEDWFVHEGDPPSALPDSDAPASGSLDGVCVAWDVESDRELDQAAEVAAALAEFFGPDVDVFAVLAVGPAFRKWRMKVLDGKVEVTARFVVDSSEVEGLEAKLRALSALEDALEDACDDSPAGVPAPDHHPELDRHIGQQAAMLELLELEATK